MPDREPFSLEVTPVANAPDRTIARVALRGLNRPVVNYGSDTTYTVLSGYGVVEIDFDVIKLEPGSVFTAPAGTPYQDEAFDDGMMLKTQSTPGFNESNIIYLDE